MPEINPYEAPQSKLRSAQDSNPEENSSKKWLIVSLLIAFVIQVLAVCATLGLWMLVLTVAYGPELPYEQNRRLLIIAITCAGIIASSAITIILFIPKHSVLGVIAVVVETALLIFTLFYLYVLIF